MYKYRQNTYNHDVILYKELIFSIQKKSIRIPPDALSKLAATYSPTWYSSTIGANGLNFSVRDGKRWIPVAITTIIYRSFVALLCAPLTIWCKREKRLRYILLRVLNTFAHAPQLKCRAISTARL